MQLNWAGTGGTNGYIGALNGAGTLIINSIAFIGRTNNNGSFSGNFSYSAGAICKIGTGIQTLSGTNSATTNWIMASGGTLTLATGYTQTTNAPLYIGSYDDTTYNDNLPSGTIGTMRFNGGTFTTSNANAVYVGSATVSDHPGVLQMDGGTITASGNGVFLLGNTNNSYGTLNQTGGTISMGSGTVYANNNGSTTACAANMSGGTFSTTNFWYNGTRGVMNTAISGTAQVTVGTFSFGYPGLAGSGSLSITGGTLTSTNGLVYSSGTNTASLNGGTIQAASNSFVWANSSNVTVTIGSSNITFDSQAFTVSTAQILGGTGGPTKIGSGIWTLSGANTYSGPTTVNIGTFKAGVATVGTTSPTSGAFGKNSTTSITGTLDINGLTQTLGSITGSGTITSSSAGSITLYIGGDNTSPTFSGIIQNGSGTVALNKFGTGAQTLSGNNTYTGITTISSGSIIVNNLANGGSSCGIGSATNVASNLVFSTATSTLEYTGSATVSTDRAFTLTAGGTINASGTGALTWNGAPTFSSSGVLTLTGTSSLNNTFGGVIAGAANGAVTKTGSGTWILGGINTYTGATTISAGKLLVNGSLASGTTTTVNGGLLGGTGTLNGASSFSNTIGTSMQGDGGATGTLTLTGPVTIGGSTVTLVVNTNGTTACSNITINLSVLGSVNLNGITVNFGVGQNINAGTYNILSTAGLLTSLTGSATVGTLPANRTTMSLAITGGNLQVTVS